MRIGYCKHFGATDKARGTRLGASLIELLTVMSVGAVLTGIVVTSMAALFRYDRQATQHSVEREQMQLLVRQLRDDIRQATECRSVPDEQLLTLVHGDQETVSFRLYKDHAERTIQSKDSTETASYRIPPTLKIVDAPARASRGEPVKLRLASNQKTSELSKIQVAPDWNLEIQATVGRDAPTRNQ